MNRAINHRFLRSLLAAVRTATFLLAGCGMGGSEKRPAVPQILRAEGKPVFPIEDELLPTQADHPRIGLFRLSVNGAMEFPAERYESSEHSVIMHWIAPLLCIVFVSCSLLAGDNRRSASNGSYFIFTRDVNRGQGARYVSYRFDLATKAAEPFWPALPDSVPDFAPLSSQTLSEAMSLSR